MIIGLIWHGRPTVMRRLLIRSKRRVLIASDYLERALAPGRASTRQSWQGATDRARSFHVARWSLETGTSVPVAPVWTRATGRELVAIDRARFGKVSCGHGLRLVQRDLVITEKSEWYSNSHMHWHTINHPHNLVHHNIQLYSPLYII